LHAWKKHTQKNPAVPRYLTSLICIQEVVKSNI